ncbi:MAG: bifunctional phosphopantothenoylcysteine decarboxylase/phosphopantothenate--cysteine ligase CoaBC, partial [Clostridia bacterium]
ANGIADDMLSTTVMAAKCPVIFAPAMNCNMYENAIVQENIEKLKSYDYSFVAPGHGRLACGDIGQGKLADIEDILDTIIDAIAYEKNLKGHKVLVTAGPTREPLDPVRFVTNYSSGKMGYAIAKAARYRGAQVTLITGPTGIAAVKGVKTISVNTALEMYDAVLDYYKEASMIIKAAAVGDYRPLYTSENKIKKSDGNIDLILTKNPDILMELGKRISKQVLIGFSMETQNLEGYAREKLLKKNLDLIVANNLSEQGAGFSVDTNIVTIIDKNGNIDTLPIMAKEQLAHMILDKGLQIYQQKRNIHSD